MLWYIIIINYSIIHGQGNGFEKEIGKNKKENKENRGDHGERDQEFLEWTVLEVFLLCLLVASE